MAGCKTCEGTGFAAFDIPCACVDAEKDKVVERVRDIGFKMHTVGKAMESMSASIRALAVAIQDFGIVYLKFTVRDDVKVDIGVYSEQADEVADKCTEAGFWVTDRGHDGLKTRITARKDLET